MSEADNLAERQVEHVRMLLNDVEEEIPREIIVDLLRDHYPSEAAEMVLQIMRLGAR